MTYETVLVEMFSRFPEMRAGYETQVASVKAAGKGPLPFSAFGGVLVPALESAMEKGDLRRIGSLCAYLEDVAWGARNDLRLRSLLRIEIGEWLEYVANEDRITQYLGSETRRVCRYVPGLATQRRRLKEEKRARSLKVRMAGWVKGVRGR
jgi:hypothetical protein